MLSNIKPLFLHFTRNIICHQKRNKFKHSLDTISRCQLNPYFLKEEIDYIFNARKHIQSLSKNNRIELFNQVKKADKDIFHIPSFSNDNAKKYYGIYMLISINDIGFNNWRKTTLKLSFNTYSLFQYRHDIFGIPKYKIFQIMVDRSNCNYISSKINDEKLDYNSRTNNITKMLNE